MQSEGKEVLIAEISVSFKSVVEETKLKIKSILLWKPTSDLS
jgi:hypothetical protein